LDVFLHDTVAGVTKIVSLNYDGSGTANGFSFFDHMASNGRFIVFDSEAGNLVTNDFNGRDDVFLRDMSNSVVELINVNSAGTASGNDASYGGMSSEDGRYVLFQSYATDLNAAYTMLPDVPNIYLRDRVKGTNILCSIATNHTEGADHYVYNSALSADGRVAVFSTRASNLLPGAANGRQQIFAYDVANGVLQLVSVDFAGMGGGSGSSSSPVLSADGRYVAFQSYATNLVANALQYSRNVFVRDLVARTTTLVSVDCEGAHGSDDYSGYPALSADGRFATFESYAANLAPGGFPGYVENVFRRDMLTGTTLLLSFNTNRSGPGDDASFNSRISADGQTVAFESYSSNLAPNDNNNYDDDVFVWRAPAAGPAGTNATIAALRMTGGRPALVVNGSPGTLYLLQRTASLTPPISWTPVGTTNAPASGQFEFIDPAPSSGSAFYRVARP
jgi:hypothetical protein